MAEQSDKKTLTKPSEARYTFLFLAISSSCLPSFNISSPRLHLREEAENDDFLFLSLSKSLLPRRDFFRLLPSCPNHSSSSRLVNGKPSYAAKALLVWYEALPWDLLRRKEEGEKRIIPGRKGRRHRARGGFSSGLSQLAKRQRRKVDFFLATPRVPSILFKFAFSFSFFQDVTSADRTGGRLPHPSTAVVPPR